MAISVDRVYQTVLALANKEQRGYITPQEFNLFATHAQNSIFEQYFYDLNQFRRIPGNNTVTADPRDIIEEKIALFRMWVSESNTAVLANGDVNTANLVPELYRIEEVGVHYKNQDAYNIAEELSGKELSLRGESKLAKWSKKRPVFIKHGVTSSKIKVFPYPDPENDKVKIDYIRKPNAPRWTYIIVNDQALWNPTAMDKRDFELHPSEEKNLVIQILKLAGVSMKDYNVTQLAAQEEAKSIQQEKS
jgi:hypothetical protein